MTKQEAIAAMGIGETVSHSSFTDKEWLRDDGRMFEFEDGCKCSYSVFWSFREQDSWNDGWSKFN